MLPDFFPVFFRASNIYQYFPHNSFKQLFDIGFISKKN